MPLARCSSKEGGIVKKMQSADSEHPFYDPLDEVVGVAKISGVGQALPGTMRGGNSRGNLARGLQFFSKKKKRPWEEERERPNCLHPRWTQPNESSHVETDQQAGDW